MEKILNMFGLTTIKNADIKAKLQAKEAVEQATKEKSYQKLLNFTRFCRKYKFRVVAVDMDDAEAMAHSRLLAQREYDLDMSEQNEFTNQFIPNLKQSENLELLN